MPTVVTWTSSEPCQCCTRFVSDCETALCSCCETIGNPTGIAPSTLYGVLDIAIAYEVNTVPCDTGTVQEFTTAADICPCPWVAGGANANFCLNWSYFWMCIGGTWYLGFIYYGQFPDTIGELCQGIVFETSPAFDCTDGKQTISLTPIIDYSFFLTLPCVDPTPVTEFCSNPSIFTQLPTEITLIDPCNCAAYGADLADTLFLEITSDAGPFTIQLDRVGATNVWEDSGGGFGGTGTDTGLCNAFFAATFQCTGYGTFELESKFIGETPLPTIGPEFRPNLFPFFWSGDTAGIGLNDITCNAAPGDWNATVTE